MCMSDPIADMLTRLRNAQKARLIEINVPHSRIKENVLTVLLEEGYISNYKLEKNNGFNSLNVSLKYLGGGKGAISEITRMSKPGRRLYTSVEKLAPYKNGLGVYVLSTPKGIVSDRVARALGIGGEVLCRLF